MKMTSTKGRVRARLLTSTLLAGLATVAAPLAITAVATAIPTLASAQDYTSGTLMGTVTDTSGAPVSGAAVVVKSNSTGVTRELTTNGAGEFRAPLIPLGSYSVSINKDGFDPIANSSASVRLGGESAYGFTLNRPGEVDAVVVTGTANPQLDFAATTTGLTVDIEELAKQVPVARNITAVTLLAPGAIRGTQYANSAGGSRIAAQPTLGGASAAENAFYINGLNITNFATYLGGSTVPFDFYKTIEVKTGGLPAEFGRITGGVVNAVTKSGGNDFHFTVSGNYSPSDLQESSPDTIFYKGKRSTNDSKDVTFQVSGPIIEDHLFFYVMNQQRQTKATSGSVSANTYVVDKQNDPFWGAKLDAYITSRQHLELTWFDTSRTTDRTTYAYASATDTIGAKAGNTRFDLGGQSWVGKYTGSFTDWLTVSAAYGVTEDSDSSLPSNTTTPYVLDSRPTTPVRVGAQTDTSATLQQTRREFYRADIDLYFDLLGKHHVRAGLDNEKTDLYSASVYPGGSSYTYYDAANGDVYGVANTDGSFPTSGANSLTDDYVAIAHYINGGSFKGKNTAYYIQDSWDVLDNLTLQLGVRYDKFKSMNPTGEAFVDFHGKDTIGPRLGFSWDPLNDGKNKVYGSFGRYFLPVASNTAYRMTGGELYFTEYYRVASDNAATTYIPTLGSQITAATVAAGGGSATLTACPAGGFSAAGTVGCTVTSNGEPVSTESTVSKNIKPTYQDEYQLGFERQFTPLWKGSINLTYRTLGRAAEDAAIDKAVLNYCTKNGIAGCAAIWGGFHQYVIINPGSDQTITLSDPINGEATPRTINFTAADLGYPNVKREYIGLTFAFERAFDGKWSLQGSYVMSESKGNYEGAVKSDIGQTDTSITQDFDQPGLMDGAYGLLPNHRGHQFKAFGTYAITENFLIGANASIISPHKLGCLGRHPTDAFAQAYGASSFYCTFAAIPAGSTYAQVAQLTPRGSQSSTDWQTNLDLTFSYTIPKGTFGIPGDLQLRADVFNVFNSDAVTNTFERGTLSNGNPDSRYLKPTAYQSPRSVRFGFDWAF